MTKTLVVITGPTGIGKTALSINVASHFKTEIVSCDSRQIFRELSIGTAVPTDLELNSVPHHFIHSHSIRDNYNVSRYENEAIELIVKLFRQHDLLVLAGGSMLYIEAICKGIDNMPDADPEIRKELKQRLKNEGLESLRLQLRQLDPDYYKTVDLKNPARIVHALEISIQTGRPYSSFRTNQQKRRPFSILKIGLNGEREELHRCINLRVDKMMEAGLEKEARSVYAFKYLPSLNTVGYRELFAYFDGEISREKAIELIKRNSRRYARKQLTWFRRDQEFAWFQPNQSGEVIDFIRKRTTQA